MVDQSLTEDQLSIREILTKWGGIIATGVLIGAIVGLGSSFTTPLMLGWIIGALSAVLYNAYKEYKIVTSFYERHYLKFRVNIFIASIAALVICSSILSPVLFGTSPELLSFFAIVSMGAIAGSIKNLSTESPNIWIGYPRLIVIFSSFFIASASIGVGCAAALNAAFPGIMLGAGFGALAGAAIGGIALAAGLLATDYIITPAIDKVSEWISDVFVERDIDGDAPGLGRN